MCWQGLEPAAVALAKGHDVILCPTQHCYFDYKQSEAADEPGNIGMTPVERVYEFDPAAIPEASGRIIGVEGTVWTEYITHPEHIEFMTYPRAAALAEVAW